MTVKFFPSAFLIFFAFAAFSIPSYAAEPASATKVHSFVKKRYTIKGGWSLAKENGKTVIRFDEGFKTKGGPDLKVFLHTNTVEAVAGENITQNGLKIGVLKSNKGAQSYIIPDDVNVSDYKSVLIHCEAFSVLWGGFDIPQDSATDNALAHTIDTP